MSLRFFLPPPSFPSPLLNPKEPSACLFVTLCSILVSPRFLLSFFLSPLRIGVFNPLSLSSHLFHSLPSSLALTSLPSAYFHHSFLMLEFTLPPTVSLPSDDRFFVPIFPIFPQSSLITLSHCSDLLWALCEFILSFARTAVSPLLSDCKSPCLVCSSFIASFLFSIRLSQSPHQPSWPQFFHQGQKVKSLVLIRVHSFSSLSLFLALDQHVVYWSCLELLPPHDRSSHSVGPLLSTNQLTKFQIGRRLCKFVCLPLVRKTPIRTHFRVHCICLSSKLKSFLVTTCFGIRMISPTRWTELTLARNFSLGRRFVLPVCLSPAITLPELFLNHIFI